VTLGTANVSNGTATIQTSALPVGANQTLTATYTGSGNYLSSSGTLSNYSVSSASTGVAVSAAPSSGDLFGQSVTLTATVSNTSPGSGAAVNEGSVSFSVGGQSLGSGTFHGNGVWTLTTTALPAGTNETITAAYSDASPGSFSGTTGTLSYTVGQDATRTSVSSAPSSSSVGQSVTFTATVINATVVGITPTGGTVTFYDGNPSSGGTAIGSGTLSNGTATANVSSLAFGTHQIYAVYGGATDFAGSTGGPITQTVAHTTQTTISPSSASVVYGQAATFTVNVATTDGGGAATGGTVTLLVNGAQYGSARPLSANGNAQLTVTGLAVGAYSVTASYSGNAPDFGASATAQASALSVGQASTALTVSASPTVASYGQTVTFTATLTTTGPGSGTPVGEAVSFFIDGSYAGQGTLQADGSAGVSYSSIGPGSYTITAYYGGDANFKNTSYAATPPASLKVVSPTVTFVGVTPGLTQYGQAETLLAQVYWAGGKASAAGPVAFFVDGAYVGQSTINAQGQASLSYAFQTVGRHSILAYFGGDGQFFGSSLSATPATDQVVAYAVTTVSASTGFQLYGQAVTFTATVTQTAPGVTPTGVVGFYVDGAYVGQGGLNAAGQASISLSSLGMGQHSIQAYYGGDSFYFGALSGTPAVDTVAAYTLTQLTASESSAVVGDLVTFTAKVLSTVPGYVPQGTVSFYVDNNFFTAVNLNAFGQASFSSASLTVGTHTIIAVYSGAFDFFGSQDALSTFTVSAARRT
jgi:hypothetical protein